jgi:hypothetical protein
MTWQDRPARPLPPASSTMCRRSIAYLMLVSDRVGNAQVHQQLGPLLDQFWVR